MTRRSPAGSPRRSTIEQPAWRAFGGKLDNGHALWREPAPVGRLLCRPATSGPASPPRGSCRARSSPTTTSTTPTPPSSWSASSTRPHAPPSPSSSTPIPAASATADTLSEAYAKALACDPVSAFGGIVALNRPLDAEAAEEIVKIFTEVIIAPDATDEAQAIVAAKKNLRLLVTGGLPDPRAAGPRSSKSVAGGFLVQARDNAVVDDLELKVVTKRAPTERELADLLFAFRVAKHVKSNAIVYAKRRRHGRHRRRPDEPRRFVAHRRAQGARRGRSRRLAEPLTKGSVVASDAFFPFADGLLSAAEAGATAVIQPGGSMRDDEVIAAADAHGLAMVFTGMRHFRH